jgi:salicylate hydroxylase
MCIEDAAVLAELLADEKVDSYQGVEAAFEIYDAFRRPRGEFLVQTSRFMGEAYERRNKTTGDDLDKVRNELMGRNSMIHDVDVEQVCRNARAQLGGGVSEWTQGGATA